MANVPKAFCPAAYLIRPQVFTSGIDERGLRKHAKATTGMPLKYTVLIRNYTDILKKMASRGKDVNRPEADDDNPSKRTKREILGVLRRSLDPNQDWLEELLPLRFHGF